MPIIQVNLMEGRDADAKRKFAADVTRLACEHLNVQANQVRIIFNEMPRENYAIAGELMADRDKRERENRPQTA